MFRFSLGTSFGNYLPTRSVILGFLSINNNIFGLNRATTLEILRDTAPKTSLNAF